MAKLSTITVDIKVGKKTKKIINSFQKTTTALSNLSCSVDKLKSEMTKLWLDLDDLIEKENEKATVEKEL